MSVINTTLHVLHLADATFQDKPGGSRKYAQETALCMLQEGHAVSFIVPQGRPELPLAEDWNGLQVIRYAAGSPIRRQLELVSAVTALHARQPIDLVIVHFAYTALGFHLSRIGRQLPTLRVFHGPWDLEHAEETGTSGLKNNLVHAVMHTIERTSLRRSGHIVCLSEFMANDARSRFGIPSKGVSIIPGGVDTKRFSPGDRAAARSRFGYRDDEFVVFCVRRLARRMGISNLVEAAAVVREQIPNLRVIIGGKGPLKEELETQIKTRGLEGCVELVGFIPDDELADRYRAADLFVLPTQALEGFGLVILESLGCGTPVLGTPVGAIPDVLRLFDDRMIAQGKTAPELAVSIFKTVGSLPNRGKLSALTARDYSWNDVTAALLRARPDK